MLLDGWKESAKRVGSIAPPVQRVERAYLTALSAGVAAFLVLSLELHHRKELGRQAEKVAMMQQIATLQQMNHHVRNALQVIGYVALHTTDQNMQSKFDPGHPANRMVAARRSTGGRSAKPKGLSFEITLPRSRVDPALWATFEVAAGVGLRSTGNLVEPRSSDAGYNVAYPGHSNAQGFSPKEFHVH